MPLHRDDIINVAKSLIADYGDEAEAEAARRVTDCLKSGHTYSVRLWRKVKDAIPTLQSARPQDSQQRPRT